PPSSTCRELSRYVPRRERCPPVTFAGLPRPSRGLQQAEMGGAAESEAEVLVQADGPGVAGRGVQERRLAAAADAVGDREHQPGGEAAALEGGVGADGADLGPARRVQPLPRHGDESPAGPDADVDAEL